MNYCDIFFSDKTYQYSLSEDSLELPLYYSQPKPLPDICTLVQNNILKNLLIKLVCRRMNWALQNLKLLGFDESTLIDNSISNLNAKSKT